MEGFAEYINILTFFRLVLEYVAKLFAPESIIA